MGRRKPNAWGVIHAPHIRRSINDHETANVTTDPVNATVRIAANTGTLFWASRDVVAATLDASQQLPDVFSGVVPARQGVMLLGRSLPDIEVPVPGVTPSPMIGVDAIVWGVTGSGLVVSLYARAEHLPDGLTVGKDRVASLGGASIHCVVVEGEVIINSEDLDSLGRPAIQHVSRWLCAAWSMMREPHVIQAHNLDTATGGVAQSSTDPAQQVRVLDIRPPTHKPGAEIDPSTGRQYHHRWVVRGHWRNQRVGAKGGQRRLTWIPSHIKGPKGAPLKTTETVWTWRT